MFGDSKRTFKELQVIILKVLKKRNHTIYEITKEASLHFNVVKHQLILLKGQDYVSLAFEHNKFRLFAITKGGMEFLKRKNVNLL